MAREMGYSSFFALQVADYGMTVQEMMALLDGTLAATAPLYDGLHCWARHTLAGPLQAAGPAPAARPLAGQPLGPELARPGRGRRPGPLLASRTTPSAVLRRPRQFYVSLGFPRLPETFWRRSDLYPVPAGGPRKKNGHASAWHIDGERDVRSLMSVEPNQHWFGTAHHELGHIYYYLAYARPEVPYLLRTGANRAFHEAVGELARLASQQPPYLRRIWVLRAPARSPSRPAGCWPRPWTRSCSCAFAAGTMTHFERDLYEAGLPAGRVAGALVAIRRALPGHRPARAPRPAELCDACTKTHLNDDPAQYYDYALATLIKFQLHDHICRKILKQDVRACDYGGQQAGGRLPAHPAVGRRHPRLARGRSRRPPASRHRAPLRPAGVSSRPLHARARARRNQGKDCRRD